MLINDNRVSNSIDSLEHRRNVACVSLFSRYYNVRYSREIRGLIPDNHIVLRSTHTSRRAYPFVVDCALKPHNALPGKFIFCPHCSLME